MFVRRVLRHGMALVISAAIALTPFVAARAAAISLIRDAEIEETLRQISGPILDAAGLGRSAVQIYIVNDSQLNAFVAGGSNLFLNTGLLMRTGGAGQLAGVIAHEVGHIAGGHLSRVAGAQRRAAAEMILATVLGAAAAVAGAPGLGTAIIGGGQTYAQSNFMRFNRSQEQSADQAAVTYLDHIGVSSAGLAEFFKILENQNILAVSRSNPYLQTHPLTRDRIRFVESHVAGEGGRFPDLPSGWPLAHGRMVVKLEAFLLDPRDILQRYQADDTLLGRYARAVALYRLPDLPAALEAVDGLIGESPGDPYFHELKGQMLFENGRIEDAIPPYRKAVELRPDAPLLRVGLAQALIESGTPGSNAEAIGHLEEAVGREPTNAGAWRLLGIAQGRDGLEGVSNLSLAEYALLIGKQEDARLYARRAEAKIEPSDPAWLRLQDVLRVIDES
ncbi:MAG TPA: M48 family metalloprotease [Geminicoccaceae bacterium]|nr:M48 family metalloprotease [Geminicoccaceae bacterium]